MQYQKTVELWGKEDALRSGELRLQSGQWVTCGGGTKSRYHSASSHVIYCFHGGTTKQATAHYRQFVARRKEKLAA